jgi:hypothetical protein
VIGWLIFLVLLTGYAYMVRFTFHKVRLWEFRYFEKEHPGLYSDESYRRKSWNEDIASMWFFALLWPVSLPMHWMIYVGVKRNDDPPAPRNKP